MTTYRTIEVDGTEIFYREAGAPEARTLLLLEGFPSSSAQYEQLIGRLADRFHLVAPDYPGFGRSTALAGETTFDRVTAVIDTFTRAKGLERFAVYMFDFGAPVGFRLATRHPERIEALVIQNGNAYEDGLGPNMQALKPYWADRAGNETAIRGLRGWRAHVRSTSTASRIRQASTRISGSSTSGIWISPAATGSCSISSSTIRRTWRSTRAGTSTCAPTSRLRCSPGAGTMPSSPRPARMRICRICLRQSCICSTRVTSRPRRTARKSPTSSHRSWHVASTHAARRPTAASATPDDSHSTAAHDGVFAITITLLVLEIEPPTDGENLLHGLVALWPSYLAYAVTFLFIGQVWVNHHVMFDHILAADRIVLLLNTVLLMVVAFLPFATSVLAEALRSGHGQRTAVGFDGIRVRRDRADVHRGLAVRVPPPPARRGPRLGRRDSHWQARAGRSGLRTSSSISPMSG
jgi:pimeloyl-ACP methyl ester carboxylesterase